MPPKRSKTIEEQYMKLTQHEHILLRPDSYVGSIEMQKEWVWTYDAKTEEMSQTHMNFVPGLYKIFDEILVNAADNYERDPEHQTYIKVVIDGKAGKVSIENNGQGLPVEMHQEHKMYVPEMVFGHLLTSDNYDDDEKKIVGGRNGYGAKLTNIFSTRFEIECADGQRGKLYKQTWEDNMKNKGTSQISAHKGQSFTKITFWPDLKRFGMKKLDEHIVGLMSRRVMDIAGCTPKTCKVYLNGKPCEIGDFKDYVDIFVNSSGSEAPLVVHETPHERWQVAVTVSDGQFQQVSFVNRISTLKGGTHVAHVADQLVEAILKKVNKQNKGGMELKPFHVKNYLWVFVNCQIENPSFDSQTKETMTLKASKFGSKCEITDAMINKVLKTGIVDMVLQWAKAKEEIDLGKTMSGGGGGGGGKKRRLFGIPKLEDANLAGGKEGRDCTLILTEGDSAKALAVAGLSIIGRDRYGVFPLRGKLLNVRDANHNQTMNNVEIAAIAKILGIEPKRKYQSTAGMRYGHIMVMADQDYDGSHIKGLILNLIQHWWPSLFQFPGFVQEFVTPIVKVSKRNTVQTFFTMQEYDNWKQENNNGRGWQIKYYKGLGTSTTQEAKVYFRAIDDHSLEFQYTGDGDDENLDMAFNQKRADDRKEWINGADDEEFVDHSKASLTYSDFVEKELVQFAKYNVMRSIPSVVDGFKPVQRKILWASFKRRLNSDTKVAQLSGYVSEHAAYHHGEASLQGAIVSLAQTFVGSNNVNLLTPSGQFGTRLQGGKDQASARYIYTRLEKITRLIFHPADDKLVKYLSEEGQSIEPSFYIPVIPLLLVNGADGIGTGWSTFLPNYDPRDIIVNLKRYIRCEPLEAMCPWYSGFVGSIVPSPDKDGYDVIGVIEKRGPTTLEITELPVRKWTQDYKETLQGMLSMEGAGSGQIENFVEYHTETTVHFVITVTEEQMEKLERTGLEKAFRMRSSLATSNMVFFDREGKIRKYASEREIVEDFAELRLEYYHKRKAFMLKALMQQLEILEAKARFIELVIAEKLKVKNRKREALIEDLRKNNFRTLHEITEGDADVEVAGSIEGDSNQEAAEGKEKKKKTGGWEYLLGMPLWSLTMERILDLEAQMAAKVKEVEDLELTAPEELWDRDLDEILAALDDMEDQQRRGAVEERRMRAGAQRRAASSMLGAAGKRRKTGSSGALPELSAPPQAARELGTLSPAALLEMQQRHLARTVTEFPGLFSDVLPDGVPSAGSGGTGGPPGAKRPRRLASKAEDGEDAPAPATAPAKLGGFAKRQLQGRGGRGQGSGTSRGRGRGRSRGADD